MFGMKKYILWLIVSCIIIVLIILLILLTLSTKKEKKEENNNLVGNNNNNNSMENLQTNEIEEKPEEIYLDKQINRVNNVSEYYTTEKCIKSFLIYLKANNQSAIYGISQGNSIFDISDIINGKDIQIKEMYSIDNDYGTTFFTKVRVNGREYNLRIIQDFVNNTFGISGISNQEYLNITTGGDVSKYSTYTQVPKNEYNNIVYVNLDNAELAEKYLASYVYNARYYPEEAYNSLDEEYRNKKFGNYQNFVAYLTETKKAKQLESLDPKSIKDISSFPNEEEYKQYIYNLEQKGMAKYDIYEKDGINYCICVDDYNNYYIFKIINVMNYELMLDTYTIDLPQFIEEYRNATTEEKVILNIKKIFRAINDKDYSYVYNKLDAEYKANNFSNYDTFKSILQNNFFENNTVKFDEFIEEGQTYKYVLLVTDTQGINANTLRVTIVMTLGLNTEFTIKFE